MNNVYTVITSTEQGVLGVVAFGNKKQAQAFLERQQELLKETAVLNPDQPKTMVSLHKTDIVRNRRK